VRKHFKAYSNLLRLYTAPSFFKNQQVHLFIWLNSLPHLLPATTTVLALGSDRESETEGSDFASLDVDDLELWLWGTHHRQ
jgi:hypothetical protein